MTTLVYSTHINRFPSLINLIGIPLLLILITLLHYLPLMSLEITTGMKGGNKTPTEVHPPRTASRSPSFHPSPHIPGRLSNTLPSTLHRGCSLTLVSPIHPFRSILPPLRQRVPSDVAPSQWTELRPGALHTPPPHTRAIPRHRTPLKNTLRPRRRENGPMRNNCES